MSSTPTRRRLLMASTFALGLHALRGQAAVDADYPNRAIRLVTPFAPGASTDMLARAVAAGMTARLGQPVVVDSKPGAGGTVAAMETLHAPPDGYTFMLASAGIVTMNPSIYRKLPYDQQRDFAPLTIAVRLPLIILANPSRPYRTVPELIAYAKAHPGQVSYGSAGIGTSQHMGGELFKSMAGVDLMHVPYKGGAPAMADLIGGQIDLLFGQIPSALAQVKAGKARAIAVGSPARAAVLPEVPTVSETGLAGYDGDTWYGFVASSAIPPALVGRLQEALVAATRAAMPQLEREGFLVVASSPQEMARVIRDDAAKWAGVIRAAGIRLE